MGEEGFVNGDQLDSKKKGGPKALKGLGAGSGATPRKLQKGDEEQALALAEENMTMDEPDEETQQALDGIDAIQGELDGLNEKATEEILTVERKYNQLRKPVLVKRQEIVAKIPHFWITAMRNHPQISMLIDEEEDDCLQFLSKIFIEENDDIKSGFKIEFHFEPNPYFENEVLVKEYLQVTADGFTCENTQINWKTGMDLIKKMGKITLGKRKRIHDTRTFFSWFMESHLQPTFDEIGETLKDDLWANPLSYYMGPGEEDDDELDEEGDEMDDDSDDDGEGDEAIIVEEEEEVDDEDV